MFTLVILITHVSFLLVVVWFRGGWRRRSALKACVDGTQAVDIIDSINSDVGNRSRSTWN